MAYAYADGDTLVFIGNDLKDLGFGPIKKKEEKEKRKVERAYFRRVK